jgi:hypothetical protein
MSDSVAVEVAPKQNNFDRIPKCGAHSRSTGKPCQQPAMPNGRCRKHGGLTPVGPAHPNYQTGRYSKVKFPAKFLELYEEQQNDTRLLEMSDDIALLNARLSELLEKINTEESEERWAKTKEQYKLLVDGLNRKDQVAQRAALNELGHLLRDGDKDYMVWNDIMKTMHSRNRMVAQETKRRLEMHALISADQVMGFVGTIMYAIKAHVTDPKALMEIHKAIQEALDRNPTMATGLRR